MLNSVVLIHRRGPDGFKFDSSHWFVWQTCLRKIAFGSADALNSIELCSDDDVLTGLDAYRFCLEVICGLHSPLIGETEVFGQFKNAVESWQLPLGPWGNEMRRFLRQAFADAKKIRAHYLADLGSQSYGSLLRRELKSAREVHVIGGGHLVGEILPWLCKDGTNVIIHVRDLTRVEALRREFPMAHFQQLEASSQIDATFQIAASFQSATQTKTLTDTETDTEASIQTNIQTNTGVALVVAAPVSAEWMANWMRDSQKCFTRVADLRGDADTDSLATHLHDSAANAITGLGELMRRIADNQELLLKRRFSALEEIEQIVLAHSRYIEYRPFGWEDVCA